MRLNCATFGSAGVGAGVAKPPLPYQVATVWLSDRLPSAACSRVQSSQSPGVSSQASVELLVRVTGPPSASAP